MCNSVTHAGAVAIRRDRDRTLYLIVASSDASSWVLPKGHIETGESPDAAALRELREEAGVVGQIVSTLPTQRFERRGVLVSVQYFLVRELICGRADDNRSVHWADFEAGMDLLTFDDSKEILRHADTTVSKLEGWR